MIDRFGDKPSLEQMIYYRDSLNGLWQASIDAAEASLDQGQEEEENLYFQRFDIESPGGRLAVRTGSAPSDADAAIDSLTPTDVQVRVRPARARKVHEDRADLLARFGRALINDWRRGKDRVRTIAGDQAIRRVGVFRVMLDDKLWPPRPSDGFADAEEEAEWTVKHRRRNPIMMERRNPRYTRWKELDDGTLAVVVEYYLTSVLEARIAFGGYDKAVTRLVGRSGNEPVWVSDIWFGEYRCLLLDDDPILEDDVEEHGYLEMPYVIVPFRELPFDEPGRRYRGMLSNAAGLYPIESNVYTMHVHMLAWNAYRTWKGWVSDPGRQIRMMPGEVVMLDQRRGEYIEMIQGEPVPPELMQTASIIDSLIQRNGVAQGPRTQEGTRSAQQVWAIQSLRQIKVEPGKQALQRGLERALTLACNILRYNMVDKDGNFESLTLPLSGKDREGKPLGSVTVSGKDVDGYEEAFDVTFGRRLDPALLQQATSVMQMAANEWMPRRISWELSGLTESPDEWEDELIRQRAEGLDFMIEGTAYEMLAGWYGEDDWRTSAFQQKMQNPQITRGRRGQPAPMQPNQALPTGPSPNGQLPSAQPSPAGGSTSRAAGRFGAQPPANAGGGGMPGQSSPGMP